EALEQKVRRHRRDRRDHLSGGAEAEGEDRTRARQVPTRERRRPRREAHDHMQATGNTGVLAEPPERIEMRIAEPSAVDHLRRHEYAFEAVRDAVPELALGFRDIVEVHERDRHYAVARAREEVHLPAVVG